ncbi:MAG: colicin V production protein [Denitrovibrio sp.]|nr:MAG: colicin V production protein [Denitrovibrio sp.]
MGIVDIVLLIIIGIVAVKGLIKGLIMEIFGLLALVAGYIVAYKYSHIFAKPVAALGLDEKASNAIGYVIGFIIAYIIVVMVGTVLSKAFKEIKLGSVNRGGGLVFGALKAAVILGLILSTVITVLPKKSTFSKNLQAGMVSGRLAKVSPYVYKVMNKIPDVEKINPLDMPEVKKTKDAMELLESDAVQDALEAVKDSKLLDEVKDLPENTKDVVEGLTNEEIPENPLKGMQKE